MIFRLSPPILLIYQFYHFYDFLFQYLVQRFYLSKKIFKATIKNRKKNGESYYVDSTIVPILDENNDIIQYISMRYDVTKLVEAIEVADKAKRIRDEFLANMSHEIRTPLNGIIGFVEILLKQNNDKRSNHFLEIIHSSAQMLLRIVNDVLELSKLQSGKFQIELLPFNPIEEVGAVISLFNSQIIVTGKQIGRAHV